MNMMKKCITAILALTLVLSLWTLAEAEERTGRVFGGWLILRASPSYTGQIRSSYPSGTVVTITGQSGAWYQVKAPDGLTGYMLGSYLKVDGGSVPSGTKAYVVSQNGMNVRLRSGPGTGYSTIASYAPGTECTILDSGASWSRIRIGSYTGYMMSRYLSGQIVPTPVPDPGKEIKAWVISRNGHGVNLRSGPGKGYASIGFYSVGTQAAILSAGPVWSYIRIGTRHGYMMSEFLTTVAPVVPPVPIPGGAYVVSENGKGVNLRTGPGKQYGVIRVIPAGTPVTIITRGVEWHYVKAGDFFGYMMSRYIHQAIGPQPRPTGKPTATPTATPTPTPAPTPTPKPTTLKKGSKGEEVKQLQKRLKELKYLDLSIPSDGDFGDLTEKAVKAFQKINSITPDGIVGGTTHAVLNSDMAIPKPDGKTLDEILAAEEAFINITLKPGDKNEDVKKLQDRLKVLKYLGSDVTSDGDFGPLTEKAVKAFQKINAITPDGIVGETTRAVLNSDKAVPKPDGKTLDQILAAKEAVITITLKRGDKNEDVRKMQIRLQELKYFGSEVTIDDEFGQLTEDAVKAFQYINKIEADGIAGPMTLTKMAGDEAIAKPDGKTLEDILNEIAASTGGKKSAPVQSGTKSGESDTANTVDESIKKGVNPDSTSTGGESGSGGNSTGSGNDNSGGSGTGSGSSSDTGSGNGSGNESSNGTGTGSENADSNAGSNGNAAGGNDSSNSTGGGSESSGNADSNSSAGRNETGSGSESSNAGSDSGNGSAGGNETGGGSEGSNAGSDSGNGGGSGSDTGNTNSSSTGGESGSSGNSGSEGSNAGSGSSNGGSSGSDSGNGGAGGENDNPNGESGNGGAEG